MDIPGAAAQLPGHPLTGTNGKTSTTRMIETLLREMGLTTGRFTSPHLHDIRERIAIGGEPISRAAFPRRMSRFCRSSSMSTVGRPRPAGHG